MPLPDVGASSPEAQLVARVSSLAGTLLEALDRVGYGGLLVDGRGDVCAVSAVNATARRLLEQILERRPGLHDDDWLRQAARRLQNHATPWFPRDAEAWATIATVGESHPGDRPLALYRMPLADGDGGVLLILADFNAIPQPSPATLRRIFGLTAAEAKVALEIGRGDMLSKIARDHRVCVATVRSQLASVFAKTNTRRQTELAMLLARIAILP